MIVTAGPALRMIKGFWGTEPPEQPGGGLPPAKTVVVVAGSPGPPGSGTAYEHVQSSASTTWTVNHNLQRSPTSVRVLSPGGVEVEAYVTETNLNQLVVSFAIPRTGRVLVI